MSQCACDGKFVGPQYRHSETHCETDYSLLPEPDVWPAWIACVERMPPDREPVLVYGLASNDDRGPKDEPMIAVYECQRIGSSECVFWHSVGDCGYEHEDSIDEPTHWMPLPPAPEPRP